MESIWEGHSVFTNVTASYHKGGIMQCKRNAFPHALAFVSAILKSPYVPGSKVRGITSMTATVAPSLSSFWTSSPPMPLDPPVTTMTSLGQSYVTLGPGFNALWFMARFHCRSHEKTTQQNAATNRAEKGLTHWTAGESVEILRGTGSTAERIKMPGRSRDAMGWKMVTRQTAKMLSRVNPIVRARPVSLCRCSFRCLLKIGGCPGTLFPKNVVLVAELQILVSKKVNILRLGVRNGNYHTNDAAPILSDICGKNAPMP